MRISDFFYMRKSDRMAMLTLLAVIVSAVCVVWFVGGRNDRTLAIVVDDSTSVSGDSAVYLNQQRRFSHYYNKRTTHYYNVEGRQAELFVFDPNTADSTTLLRLGLQPWQVRNIYKYRSKGGIYRKPSDFARLYGLTVKQYKALEPYIRISEEYRPASSLFEEVKEETHVRDTLKYPVKIQLPERIVLNTADTTQLKKVPGIGSAYARAIVNYRERLGGYYRVEQLYEIEGLPESCIPFFVISNPVLRKLKINKLTLNQLRRHPYINFHQAKAIVDYRRLRGPLTSLQDLRLNRDFPPEAIERLEPYVEY